MKLSDMQETFGTSSFNVEPFVQCVIENAVFQGLVLVFVPVFLLNIRISWMSFTTKFQHFLACLGLVLFEALVLFALDKKNVDIKVLKSLSMESSNLMVLIMFVFVLGRLKSGFDQICAIAREIQIQVNHIIARDKKQVSRHKKVYCDKSVCTEPMTMQNEASLGSSSSHAEQSSELPTAKEPVSLARTYSEKLCNLVLMPRHNIVSDKESFSESNHSIFSHRSEDSEDTNETFGSVHDCEVNKNCDWRQGRDFSKGKIEESLPNAVFVGTNLADSLVPIDKSKSGNFIANMFMKRKGKTVSKQNRLRRTKRQSDTRHDITPSKV